MQPEVKVKKAIHGLLAAHHAWAVNYIGGPMGNNGTPDILACLNGRCIGVEAKAGRGKPTELQLRSLRLLDAAGGLALIINETNLDYLRACLQDVHKAESNYHEWVKP
jgi:hypothetical protein